MTNKILKTPRKQTYPFKTMAIDDSFKVAKQKYNSMLTAYRQHNKKHEPIVLSAELSSPGFYTITRTK